MTKVPFVCRKCDDITWISYTNILFNTDRRYHICDICSVIEAESNVRGTWQLQSPQQQKTLQDF